MHGLKIVMLGQFLITKYLIGNEFRYAVVAIDQMFDNYTKSIGILNMGYAKIRELAKKLVSMSQPPAPGAAR